MMAKLAVMLMAAVLLLGALLAWVAVHPDAPQPQLHSVWCVRQGYPPDLALPFVVGPGTGLSGCPAGERQVQP